MVWCMYARHRKNKVHYHPRQVNLNTVRYRHTILHSVAISYLVSVCVGPNATFIQSKDHCRLCAWTGGVILQHVIRPHIKGVRPCTVSHSIEVVWDDSEPWYSWQPYIHHSMTLPLPSASRCYALSVQQSAWHSSCHLHTSIRSSNSQNGTYNLLKC